MRCPDCNKFVSFEERDPEVQSLEVDEDGNVRAEIRLVNACSECGTELKEANFELEADHCEECKGHQGEGHDLTVEEQGCDRGSRSGYFDRKKKVWVNKYGRYAKTMYSVSLDYTITCTCGKLESISGTIEDEVQASGMEELV
jgi:hypothetical protein